MFSTIQDSVDANIRIIRHNPTGFYNATKAANQFNALDPEHNKKKIFNWLPTAQTKALFAATKEIYNLGEVMFQLKEGTLDEHKGTYVHHTLYRSFLMWLNAKYAIKIFAIIDDHQRASEWRLTQKVSSLEELIASTNAKLDTVIQSNAQLMENTEILISDNDELKETTEKLEFDLESTRTSLSSKLDTVVDMLKQKSMASTQNPRNPEKVHHFLVMGYCDTDEANRNVRHLSFIAGQDVHLRARKKLKLADEEHQWTVEIDKHYNANPIDLRNNVEVAVNDFIKKRVEEINATAAVQISRENIPITCRKRSATFIDNTYISYDEFKEVISGVNFDTQRCPYDE